MVAAIEEHISDLEALHIAEQRLIKHRAGRSKSYTQKEMEERYGLAADRARGAQLAAFNHELGARLASLERGEHLEPGAVRGRLEQKSGER
jgi:hypothetical protein